MAETTIPIPSVSETAVDLRILAGTLRRRLRAQARADDFSPSQIAALAHLERFGPATVTEIADAHGVRPQSMGATIAALEAADCVAGAPDPGDGRRTIYSMTDTARDWIAANRAAKEDWLVRSIEANLSAEEHEQLVVGIALLKRLVES